MTTRSVRRPGRRLQHAVRGRRDGQRPGARSCRIARPALVGPPLERVLVNGARLVLVDRRDQRVAVRPHIVVGHHSNSVRPTLVRQIVDRTMLIRRERTETTTPGVVVLRRVVVSPSIVPGQSRRETVAIHHHAGTRPVSMSAVRSTGPARRSESTRRTTRPAHTSAPIPNGYRPQHRPAIARSRPAVPPRPAVVQPDPSWSAGEVARDRRPGTAAAMTVDVEDLTRRVVNAIDRRLVSQRERMGRR